MNVLLAAGVHCVTNVGLCTTAEVSTALIQPLLAHTAVLLSTPRLLVADLLKEQRESGLKEQGPQQCLVTLGM